MTLREALAAQLTATTGVVYHTADRIYPTFSPEIDPTDPFQPTVVYSMAGRVREHDLEADGALDVSTWAFIALASDPDTPHEITDAAITALDGFIGSLGPGYAVQQIVFRDAQDSDAFMEQGIYAVASTFEVTAQV